MKIEYSRGIRQSGLERIQNGYAKKRVPKITGLGHLELPFQSEPPQVIQVLPEQNRNEQSDISGCAKINE